MGAFPFEIDYYSTSDGKRPFKSWLDRLTDVTARAKIRVRLDRARLGNLGDYRAVGGGVHELRVDYGPGYRVYFAIEGKHLLLLLFGGDKSRQQRDISIAREYWRDYLERKEYG
jgi:putative addiction module killer protein